MSKANAEDPPANRPETSPAGTKGQEANGTGARGKASASLDEAAKYVSAASLTFLLTTSFLGITAFSITHLQLLIGHRVRLPLLDVEVSVLVFSVVAPVMAVLFHVVFLLQLFLLAREARRRRRDNEPDTAGEVSLPTVFVQVFNPDGLRIRRTAGGEGRYGAALWLVARFLLAIILVILPVALLAVIQWRFVPYHSFGMTLFHQIVMTVDLAFCLALAPLILAREDAWSKWWKSGWVLGDRPRYFTRALFVAFLAVAAFFSWFLAVVPHTLTESLWGRRLPLADLLQRDLLLSGAKLGAEAGSECPTALPTADLSGRDLRGADLSRARLVGVDFRGADLREARMVDSVLRCADLSPVGPSELIHLRGEARRSEAIRLDSPLTGRARLRGADLSGADLRGAHLELADLRGADLTGADLRGAEAIRADLRGAVLRSADLTAADLSYSRLDGGVLVRADATCATLYAVSARGVQAVALRANGGDLRRIDLRGASVAEADLTAVDLTDGWLLGGDLRATRLQAAVGLDLRAVDLRWSDLRGATVRPARAHPSLEVDARRVLTGDLPTDYRWHGSAGPVPSLGLSGIDAARERLRSCRVRAEGEARPTTAATPGDVLPAAQALNRPEVLLDDAEIDDRPPGAITSEAELHRRLIRSIDDGICNDLPQAALVVLRTLGCIGPRDPLLEERLKKLLTATEADLAAGDGSDGCEAVAATLAVVRSSSLAPAEVAAELCRPEAARGYQVGLSQPVCDEISRLLREMILSQP